MIDVAPDRLSFSSSELIGVRDTTEVFGISSDGSRVAGISNFASSSNFEATTWLSNSPSSGIGLGFGGSPIQLSAGLGAWDGGVVGSNAGVSDAFRWTAVSNDFQILPDTGGASEARDVSSSGSTIVGTSSDFGAVGGAVFWDSSGINQLNDPFGINSIADAISPNAEFIGGEVDFFDAGTFETGTQAGVWSGVDFSDLTLLQELDSSNNLTRLLGQVNDVTDSGYAVGETLAGDAFIWHPSFDGINSPFLGAQNFDDWLLFETGLTLDTFSTGLFSTSLVGINEDPFGNLNLALNGSDTIGGSSSSFVVTVSSAGVPEPSGGIVLFAAAMISLINRRRTQVTA